MASSGQKQAMNTTAVIPSFVIIPEQSAGNEGRSAQYNTSAALSSEQLMALNEEKAKSGGQTVMVVSSGQKAHATKNIEEAKAAGNRTGAGNASHTMAADKKNTEAKSTKKENEKATKVETAGAAKKTNVEGDRIKEEGKKVEHLSNRTDAS